MKARSREAGLSLVELVIALAVMAIALMALMVSVTSSSRLSDSNRERTIAYEMAKAKVEEIRNFTRCGSFDKIFWYYALKVEPTAMGPGRVTKTNVKGANGQIYAWDPTLFDSSRVGQPKNGPENSMQLTPMKLAGVEQPILTVTFPTNATGQLSESPDPTSVWCTKFGMPKDLNANGNPPLGAIAPYDEGTTLYEANGGTPPATAYTLIPVLVTVQWESTGKKAAYVEVATMITAK